mgnify:FL=1
MTHNRQSDTENSQDPRQGPRHWQDVNPAALFADFKSALSALTRMRPPEEEQMPPRAQRAYPFAGALIGLIGGIGFLLASGIGLPALVSSAIAVGLMVTATGALSERTFVKAVDRLASQSKGPRLVGGEAAPTGMIALVLILIAKVSLIAGLGEIGGAGLALTALIAASAAGYTGPVSALHFAYNVDEDAPDRPAETVVLQALIFCALIAFLTLYVWTALAGLLGAFIGVILSGILAVRRGKAFLHDSLAIVGETTQIAFLAASYMVLTG